MKRLLFFLVFAVSLIWSASAQIPIVGPDGTKGNFDPFKSRYQSQVGKNIIVTGEVSVAKLGWWIAFDKWGLYIHTNSKGENLDHLVGKKVTIEGVLGYYVPPEPTKEELDDPIVSRSWEHFYLHSFHVRTVQ